MFNINKNILGIACLIKSILNHIYLDSYYLTFFTSYTTKPTQLDMKYNCFYLKRRYYMNNYIKSINLFNLQTIYLSNWLYKINRMTENIFVSLTGFNLVSQKNIFSIFLKNYNNFKKFYF